MQSWDGWLHVRAERAPKAEVGVAVIFNPTARQLNATVALPLYYTGVEESAVELSVNEGAYAKHAVSRGYDAMVLLAMAPESVTTIVVRRVA